ncbi:ribosomal protein S5 domain 2-type protein [Tribonema minus]|uniref:Ribosomal protein S5 domain 2-type protein n=1 Tax=Tribonema minus TaxID=303371 RepID=A0A835ZHR0_9STRA|nr:ribosomal protein S5 domain 2-type protein [Tribonema minus]
MLNCYTPRRAPPAAVAVEEQTSADSSRKRPEHRGDGRKASELRRVYLDLGVVSQASGSAYLELDHTKVICAVYGPHAQSMDTAFSEEGQLKCDLRMAPFAQPKRSEVRGQTDEERELSATLQQALEASVRLDLLTKTAVDVYVTVLAADGGVLGAAITCASLALANASIELFDLVAACTAACADGQVLLDPTAQEEAAAGGSVLVAVMPSSREVTQWRQRGRLPSAQAAAAVELCMDGCAGVATMMRARLLAQVDK